mgnify:CR=1 FL=1
MADKKDKDKDKKDKDKDKDNNNSIEFNTLTNQLGYKENRKKLPKNISIPNIPSNNSDKKYINESKNYVNKHFSDNYGDTDNFIFPLTYAKMPRQTPIMALTPVAKPSNPSVMLAPLDTAVTIKMTMSI